MNTVACEFQIRQKAIFNSEFAPGSASGARAGWHGAIRPLHRELIFRFADRWVPRGARMLDVGCGDGEILRLFGPDRIRAGVGIDLSPEAVRRAGEARYGLARHLRFEEARFEDFDAGSGTFDVVLFLDVFEHFPDADGALARARGLLAPGGRLLILTPNVRRLTNRIRRLAARLRGETGPLPLIPSHFREYELAEIRAMLAARGFAVRDVETGGLFDFKYYPAPLRSSPLAARLNWELGRPMRELASNFMVVAQTAPLTVDGSRLTDRLTVDGVRLTAVDGQRSAVNGQPLSGRQPSSVDRQPDPSTVSRQRQVIPVEACI